MPTGQLNQVRVVVMAPAHNEEATIAKTIESLYAQSYQPEMVIVAADNCTDDTIPRALAAGAEVFETEYNEFRKAGALNQVLAKYLGGYDDEDMILIMDADSWLIPDWIKLAVPYVQEFGCVSGAYRTNDAKGWLSFFQKVEYAGERHRIARRKGRVHVLSGAASMFKVGLLRMVASNRGGILPGIKGEIYDQHSLTEDFELTLAIRTLGFKTLSPKTLTVYTDIMTDLRSLWGQRIRWQRGYLETMRAYPWRITWKGWVIQAWVYTSSLIPLLLWGTILGSWMAYGLSWHPIWLAVIPLFMAAEMSDARKAGRKGMLLAAAILPLWIYSQFRVAVYWWALWLNRNSHNRVWT